MIISIERKPLSCRPVMTHPTASPSGSAHWTYYGRQRELSRSYLRPESGNLWLPVPSGSLIFSPMHITLPTSQFIYLMTPLPLPLSALYSPSMTTRYTLLPHCPLSMCAILPISSSMPPFPLTSALLHGIFPLCRTQGLCTAKGSHMTSLPGTQLPPRLF